MKSEKEEKRKKSRLEDEDLARDIFKRSNKIIRLLPNLEVENKSGEKVNREKGGSTMENTMEMILEEIRGLRGELAQSKKETKEEMAVQKSKLEEVEERWLLKQGEFADRLRRLEEKLLDIEKKRGKEREDLSKRMDKIEETSKISGSSDMILGEIRKVENDKTMKELLEVKRKIEKREKIDRKNNIVIRWLEKKEKNMNKMIASFLKDEFGLTNGIKKIDILGAQGRELALVKLKDWETKLELIKVKRKLGTKRIYIDHDIIKEEKKVQRIIRERAGKARNEEKG